MNILFAWYNPYGQEFMKGYVEHFHQRIQTFECYDDDLWIATYPKSGTTWMQELVWSIRHNTSLDDITRDLDERIPYFDRDTWYPELMESFESCDNLPRPRTFKTHLSYDMLPAALREGKGKIINVIRNPRDVCLSYFNHEKLVRKYTGDLYTLVDIFTRDLAPLSSSFFKHVLSYWDRRNKLTSMLVVTYEEMQVDLPSVIRKVADFIDVEVGDQQIPTLCQHLSFDNMKAGPMNRQERFEDRKLKMNSSYEGTFINKGKVGRWRKEFGDEMIQKFEKYEMKWLENSDLKFVYDANV